MGLEVEIGHIQLNNICVMSMCVSKKRDHWDGPTLKKYTWLIYLDKSTWAKIGVNEFGFFLDENFKLLHPSRCFTRKLKII